MPPGRIIAANLALAPHRRPPRRDVHDGETPALPVDGDARVRSSSLLSPAFRSAAARKAGAAAAERERAWPHPPAPGLRSVRSVPARRRRSRWMSMRGFGRRRCRSCCRLLFVRRRRVKRALLLLNAREHGPTRPPRACGAVAPVPASPVSVAGAANGASRADSVLGLGLPQRKRPPRPCLSVGGKASQGG